MGLASLCAGDSDKDGHGDGRNLHEEWQDEDFPRPLPEGCWGAGGTPRHIRRRLPAPAESPQCSPDACIDPADTLETPSGSDGLEWEEELPPAWGFTGTRWVPDAEDKWSEESVDLSTVEPYGRILSQGGYHGEGIGVVLLFATCHLPHSSIPRYGYVMENLLRYIVGTLERTVANRYVLVCLSGAATWGQIPSLGCMKRCYRAVDGRLRQHLRAVIMVHPRYVRALVTLSWPFLSPIFSGKLRFAASLRELSRLVPLEPAHIPKPSRWLEPSWDGSQEAPR
ncbi:LOW QUALITY PROTEIN: bcl-2/adenovirus E1B 19 kDa-interacting protein 2-like protein [Pterocles gutturalis]